MRIICPTCASHYEVDRDQIGAGGQLVRCAQCREVWLVRNTAEAVEAEPRPLPRPVAQAPDREPNALTTSRYAQDDQPIDIATARQRLRRREIARGTARTRGGSLNLLTIGAVGAASLAMLLAFRAPIAAHLPAAAAMAAAVGLPGSEDSLALRNVHSVVTAEGDRSVLTLDGTIANLGNKPAPVPDLSVVVRDNGRLPLYAWTAAAPKPILAKGEAVAFHSRLDTPPTAGHDIRVSFAAAAPAWTPRP